MSSFFGGNSAVASGSTDMAQRKEQMKQQIQQEYEVLEREPALKAIGDELSGKRKSFINDRRGRLRSLAIANAQQLINKINENCFEKCVPKPGPSLGTSEEACLSRCMTLYSAAFDQISQKYVARVVRERGAQAAPEEIKLGM